MQNLSDWKCKIYRIEIAKSIGLRYRTSYEVMHMTKTMDKDKYIPRIIDDTVERYLAAMGSVCIEGPKWCGKTWTSAFHSNSEFLVGNPENNFQNRALAEMSPALVLEGETPRLIKMRRKTLPFKARDIALSKIMIGKRTKKGR